MSTSARKDCVRSLIAMTLILTVCFAMLLIWYSIPVKFKMTNKINQDILIKQHESSRWGEIPGDLGYSFSRTLNVKSFQQMEPFQMIFNITRKFTNIGYEHIQSVVNYNEEYTYQVSDSDKTRLD